ncbi:MAG: hypothetical protein ABW174_10605, partial [Flavitalea sp.]
MRKLLLLAALLSYCYVHAQKNLAGSEKGSIYTYVYKLTPKQVLKLSNYRHLKPEQLTPGQKIDSFPYNDEPTSRLAAGNYLFVKAHGNRLHYQVRSFGPLRINLVKNAYDLSLFLHDINGTAITNAEVSIGNKKIPFSNTHNYYLLKRAKQEGLLTVKLDGSIYLF